MCFIIVELPPTVTSISMFYFSAEIGGFLGLLLGASVLTIVEFLDMVMLNAFQKVKPDGKVGWT